MDWFGVIWLSVVGMAAVLQVAWIVRGFRTGEATVYFRYDFSRSGEPFKFWMIIIGRMFGALVAIAMFILGLQFLRGLH